MLCSAAGCVYDLLGYVHPFLTVPHDGMKFTSLNIDLDTGANNCAVTRGGGWWYNNCGLFVATNVNPSWYGLSTSTWYGMQNIHAMVKSH